MSDHYILDDDHRAVPCDLMTWGSWLETNRGNRHVAKTDIKQSNRLLFWLGVRPDYWVSTVFLGLDHSFGSGPPLLFETMVFNRWPKWKSWLAGLKIPRRMPDTWTHKVLELVWLGKVWWSYPYMWFSLFQNWSESSEEDMNRYSTWEEAEAGHKEMVKKFSQKAGLSGGRATASD